MITKTTGFVKPDARINSFIFLCFLLCGCGSSIKTMVDGVYAPVAYDQEIMLYRQTEKLPANAFSIGTIKTGDTGFSVSCGWDKCVEKAKIEARKCGGQGLKVMEHKFPSLWSSCHRVKFDVLRFKENEN